jgi:hypothetical protein
LNLVHPVGVSSYIALQSLRDASYSNDNTSSLYTPRLRTYGVIPVATQTIIPSAPVAHAFPSASAFPAPPAPPQIQTRGPANDRRSGTQKEDFTQLEQKIISSPWYASNTHEPICGNPDSPYLADCYGIRGMSCYTAFLDAKPNGAYGCWREECSAYSTRKLEDAVKHQRTNHFSHRPFLCVPTNGTVW